MLSPRNCGFISLSQLSVDLSGYRVARLLGEIAFYPCADPKIFEMIGRRHTSYLDLDADASLIAIIVVVVGGR